MKYISKNYLILLVALLVFSSCKKGLDYQNTNAINPSNVWSDSNMIKAYLNDVYGGCMPNWPLRSGEGSGEGIGGDGGNLGSFQQGTISVSTTTVSLNYQYIDKTNYFMDQMATVPASVVSDGLKSRLIGEAKFWRAWTYWGMVSALGGVPLILHTQDATNPESLKVPRSKTSECVAQIVKDLDDAAQALPPSYSGVDYGRITRVAALGLKGRILMWYASPLFNPTNDQARWQTAYAATKAAVTAANDAGYGLLGNYRAIWYSANKEQIMVKQYYFPDNYMNFAPIRAEWFSNGAASGDQPTLDMMLAFPKRDGSPMQFDKNQLSDSVYNNQFMTDFYTNRDDRFYATVYYSGTPYPTPDLMPGQTTKGAWSWWNLKYWAPGVSRSFVLPMQSRNISYRTISTETQNAPGSGIAGFYNRKGLDTAITKEALVTQATGAKSWYSPMRYAELLLNFAECANETGNQAEALTSLKLIRTRAGITSVNCGITATTQAEYRNAIMAERQVELAFEGVRLADLRRWKRYDILNTQGKRHGLLIILKPGASFPGNTDNIMTGAVRAKFDAVYVDNLDASSTSAQSFNLDLNHWFYALPPAQISIVPDKLQQNKEWGGTFDPLQ